MPRGRVTVRLNAAHGASPRFFTSIVYVKVSPVATLPRLTVKLETTRSG